jgi:hypothetical protein
MKKLHAFGEGSEFNKQAPESFPLIKLGTNRFTRNNKIHEFEVTADDIDVIMQEFESRGKDLVLDFGHSSLSKDAGFRGDAPAAGWGDKLMKTDDGISVHVKEWTPKGRERIESGEYNYHSPVLFFDEKTGRPNALHSTAVTNIPAIHGSPKLVAASDFWEEDFEAPVAIDKYKNLATKVVSNIREMKSELNGIIVSMSDLAGDDEALKTELTAFSDGLFAEDLQAFEEEVKTEKTPEPKVKPVAFEDVETEFNTRKSSMNGEDLMGWLETNKLKLNGEIEQADEGDRVAFQEQIDFIEAKKGELQSFKEENPKLWEKGLVEKEEVILPVMAFSDSVIGLVKENSVAFSDIDETYEFKNEDIENELKTLYAFKKNTMQALDDLGTDSPEKIVEAVKKVNENALNVEAKAYVLSSISNPECQITVAMQDWAEGFYKRDKEGFKKYIADAPVAFSQAHIEVPLPSKQKAKVSQTQIKIAQAFGNNPDDVYKN